MVRVTKKPPPVHKRHTKPCKYFQLGNCSLTAEGCNFAHVIVPTASSAKGATICRFYSLGSCHNGPYCPYKHSTEGDSPYQPKIRIAGQEPRADWPGASPVDNVYHDGPPPYGSYQPYYPHDWSYSAGIGVTSPTFPSNYNSSYQSGGKQHRLSLGSKSEDSNEGRYASSSSPSDYFKIDPSRKPDFIVRADSNDTQLSDETSTSNSTGSSSFSSPRTDSDELIVATTEDPKYLEHSHEHQSRVVLTEQQHIEHVPPFVPPAYPQVPHGHGLVGLGRYQAVHASNPTQAPSVRPSRTTSRNSNKPKPSKYKTKPCKFWAQDRTCTAGEDCTFRHDEPMPTHMPASRPVPARLRQNSSPTPVEAPKPRLATPKENFFPISWRVIGGGVLIGGAKREDGRPHSTGSDESILSLPDSLKDKELSADVPNSVVENLPKLKIITRRRSNSIPPTPRSSQVIVGNLFSAESPGVL
ncbi:hypothetical protein FA15DRAFT_704101 [Coprinopsis marcescibilis]|uniref:C3H1-type domain-containing protein n=1 Tax=Coprinopsis marcescibilis TaxID=230819 RepID=A0A5C3L9L0_COPMA|nr:hypothetical protein FA15DRAFT_704101 [Coprinopsis marcescibilis]